MSRRAVLLLAAVLAGCDASSAASPLPVPVPAPAPAVSPSGFLKGQLHAHSNGSGDSDTPPEEVAAWYAAHGFDFVVLTDHNRVTAAPAPPGLLLLPGVELTQNLRTCDPPPAPGDACLLHVNALFVTPHEGMIRFDQPVSLRRSELYARAVDRAAALGGLAQLNHPNFQSGADLEVLLALAARGLALIEIANEAVDSANEGDERRPSTEALWDAALARGARVWGTATDDAHHYADESRVRARGETAYVGDRGFVMVRAAKTPAAIREAIARGDFYSSTGVVLRRLELSPAGIEIDAEEPVGFEVIADGRVVERSQGTALRHDPRRLPARSVRVRITDAKGRHAWTQPVTGG